MRRLRALGHRFRRVVDALARLDLDEDERVAAPGDDVDLAERRLPAPRRDAVALGDEEHGRAALRGEAELECRDAFLPRSAPGIGRLNPLRHDPCFPSASLASASARW